MPLTSGVLIGCKFPPLIDCHLGHAFTHRWSDCNPLNLIECDLFPRAVVELRGARALVRGHGLGVFEGECSAAIWMGKQRQSGWESGVAMLA
jgi:hypothetical protein